MGQHAIRSCLFSKGCDEGGLRKALTKIPKVYPFNRTCSVTRLGLHWYCLFGALVASQLLPCRLEISSGSSLVADWEAL